MNVLQPLSIDDRFRRVSGPQKRLAHLLAQGKTDQSFVSADTSLEDVQTHITELCKGLLITTGEYEDRRARAVALAQKFFRMEPHASSASPQDTLQPERVVERIEADTAEEEEVPAGEAIQSQEVDIDVLADKILQLRSREREVLDALAHARHGERERAAREVRLKVSSYAVYAGQLYKKLGLAHIVQLTMRKRYLLLALNRLKERIRKEAAPLPVVAPPALPVPDKQEEHVAPSPSVPTQVPPANHVGLGVVVPLPPGVTHLDLVSANFVGRQAPPGLKEEIERRRKQGLQPAFLVLIPSAVDPVSTQGHIVFLEQEDKQ